MPRKKKITKGERGQKIREGKAKARPRKIVEVGGIEVSADSNQWIVKIGKNQLYLTSLGSLAQCLADNLPRSIVGSKEFVNFLEFIEGLKKSIGIWESNLKEIAEKLK